VPVRPGTIRSRKARPLAGEVILLYSVNSRRC
jgi:hypothetical protein